jgi:hypothetical protein
MYLHSGAFLSVGLSDLFLLVLFTTSFVLLNSLDDYFIDDYFCYCWDSRERTSVFYYYVFVFTSIYNAFTLTH